MTLTNEDVLAMIPRWTSGQKEGEARTARLKEIEVLLLNYKFDEKELQIFKQEINLHGVGC